MLRPVALCAALSLGALVSVVGCSTNRERSLPRASEAGRRACQEEVRANHPAQGRQLAMRQCLATVDQRLQEQHALNADALRQAGASAATATRSPESARERFVYCRLHQSEIQAAERERQRLQSIWAVVSRSSAPGTIAHDDARTAYDAALATLERLIPEPMRDGQPLIPDAIRWFMSCEFPRDEAY